eukprot:13900815-Ditylum_brightwellii.AAC.1
MAADDGFHCPSVIIVTKEIIGRDEMSYGDGSSCCDDSISESTSVASSLVASSAALLRRRRPLH